jgi:hypothetical protein
MAQRRICCSCYVLCEVDCHWKAENSSLYPVMFRSPVIPDIPCLSVLSCFFRKDIYIYIFIYLYIACNNFVLRYNCAFKTVT